MASCPLPLAARVTHRPLRGVVPKVNSLKTNQQRNLLGSKIAVHCVFSALRARAGRRVVCSTSTAEPETTSNDAFKDEDAMLEDIVLDFSPNAPYADKMLKIGEFFERNAGPEMALRLAEVLSVFTRCASLWKWEELRGIPLEKRKRATRLKDGIAQLGPVFVKLAQTLSTRPDIVGEEAAEKLLLLQDQMGPFESEIAYEIIRSELGWVGPVVPGEDGSCSEAASLFAGLSPEPIAAASIGQVYRGVLNELDPETGLPAEVAVKVQRPGVLRRIALDLHIARQALVWLEESGLNGSEDLPNIVDEVGSGIFRELDYTQEATNMADFSEALSFLDYLKVARTYEHLTTRRVMTQEWLRGRPMKELNLEEQKKMVKMGVECSSAQLFRTGLVHADPHEGNMMYTDDGKLAILDFGLICRVDNSQQEAMAGCILNILNGDWNELIDNLRVMEMLPTTAQRWIGEDGKQADYTTDKGAWQEIDDAEFRRAFAECMDGPDPNNKVVRANFTELVVDLTALSTSYRFQLPPYMVFIIRSLTTLDFCAVRTNCNMYEVAAPTALFRALSPRSASGRDALARALLSDSGDLQWERLQQLATSAMGDKTDSKVSADRLVEAAESLVAADSPPSTSGEQSRPEQVVTAADEEEDDVQQQMQKMITDLVSTKDGVALRRILADANPGTILPPKALRVVMATVAREHFARETRNFSVRQFLSSIRNAVMRGFQADKEEKLCDVSEEGRLKCMESLNNRRKQVAWKIIMSKLSAPGGLWASIRLLGILVWAAMVGSMYGLGQRMVSKLKGKSSNEGGVVLGVTA